MGQLEVDNREARKMELIKAVGWRVLPIGGLLKSDSGSCSSPTVC